MNILSIIKTQVSYLFSNDYVLGPWGSSSLQRNGILLAYILRNIWRWLLEVGNQAMKKMRRGFQ